MASIGDVTRPAFAYDQATDTWVPVGIGPHSHTAAGVGAVATSSFAAKGDLLVGTGAGTLATQTVGANGTVLTADSAEADGVKWATPSSGGWTEITSGSFPTGASTLTISSIPTTYKFLKIILRDVRFAADGNLRARLNADNSSLYQIVSTYTGSSTIADDASINIASIDSTATDGVQIIDLPNYADSTNWKLWEFQTFALATDGTNYFGRKAPGGYRSNNQITSIQIYDNSSNNYAAGTYTILGGN
jgi:hypothetical protein